MKVLNIYANLFYEISLYFFIILSPKDSIPYVTAFFFFTWIISGLISGLPSWYVQMGFNLTKKHVDFDAIAKVTQILIVFNASLLIKHISYETILTILSMISLVNVINRIYLQSVLNRSNITFKYLNYIRDRDPLEDKILRKKSFGIGFPSLVASSLYDANSVWLTIVIFAGCFIIEMFLIHRLYKSMCVYENFNMKRFKKTIKRSLFFYVLFVIVVVFEFSQFMPLFMITSFSWGFAQYAIDLEAIPKEMLEDIHNEFTRRMQDT